MKVSEDNSCKLCGKELDVCDYIRNEMKDNWRNNYCCPKHCTEDFFKRLGCVSGKSKPNWTTDQPMLHPSHKEIKIGDKYRVKELRSISTKTDGSEIETIYKNHIGVIENYFECCGEYKFVLNIEGFTSLFVDEGYVKKLEKC